MAALSRDQAVELVGEARRVGSVVERGASITPAAFLIGLGATTFGFFFALGFALDDRTVYLAAAVFFAAVLGQSVTVVLGHKVTRRGFAHRWTAAMSAWGLVFGVGMAMGLTLFRGVPGFWIPAGVVALAVCLVGAWRELPR